jgi:L-rhamnose mutarotase
MKTFQFMLLIALTMQTTCTQNHGANKTGTESPSTHEKQRVRYGMVTGLKPEKLNYYRELHAKPWPAVLAKIKECNIDNYSIFVQKIEEKYYLFSYFEYTGDNFDADMKKMATDTTTQRWWRETDPCQMPLPEALAGHQVWTKMNELFYTN